MRKEGRGRLEDAIWQRERARSQKPRPARWRKVRGEQQGAAERQGAASAQTGDRLSCTAYWLTRDRGHAERAAALGTHRECGAARLSREGATEPAGRTGACGADGRVLASSCRALGGRAHACVGASARTRAGIALLTTESLVAAPVSRSLRGRVRSWRVEA